MGRRPSVRRRDPPHRLTMYEGLAAAAVMACASIFAVVWQGRKTRRVNTDEHRQNAAILRRHSKQLRRMNRTLEQHLDDHRRNQP